MQLKTTSDINEINESQWSEFVKKHPDGNFFQSPEAFHFFDEVKGHHPFIFITTAGNQIKAVLLAVLMSEAGGLKSFFSRRCIVWGGPLVEEGNPEAGKSILEEFDKTISGKAIYTEFRNLFNTSSIKNSFSANDFDYYEHLNFLVRTDNEEEVKKRMSSSKKRQVKKSIKEGAEIVEAQNMDQVRSFYDILEELYRTKVKKPLPDWEFFKSFYESKNLGKYLLIEYEGEILGGIMCPVYKNKIFEWYICGMDRKYNKIYPSIMATWAPIEYALAHKLEYFDFMGAGKPDDDYGVREFKSKFGGDLVNFGRYKKIHNKLLFNIGKAGLKIMQKQSA